ncbi:MAG: stage II sporulation protein M [Peptococcaceae bacterium]|nr:stage II sporulation protein M [Peptococcaceae bacterium]
MATERLLREKRYGRSWLTTLCACIFFGGFIIGSIACAGLGGDSQTALFEVIKGFLRQLTAAPGGAGYFWQCLLKEESYVLLFLFLGACSAGLPFIMALLFTKGFSVGFTGCLMLYGSPGLTGFFLLLLGLLPHNLLAVPLWLALSSFSAKRSFALLTGGRREERGGIKDRFFGAILKESLLFLLGGLLVALAEGFLSPALLSFLS